MDDFAKIWKNAINLPPRPVYFPTPRKLVIKLTKPC